MAYKRYEKYKDSSVEWIGEIPAHWEVKRIKYLVQLVTKKASDIYNDKPYIGLENIKPRIGKLNLNINEDEQLIEGESLLFKPDDVLFGKLRPYLAKCIIVDFYGRCTSELLVLRSKGKILPKYLYYFMLSDNFVEVVNSSTYGAKMPRVNWDFVGDLRIPLPFISEQEFIIDYLDQKTAEIDSLITDKEKLIEILQEKRQAIISEAVTKGLDRNVPMKDSGVEWIGEIPAHWKLYKITQIFNLISSGTTPASTNLEYYDGSIPWVNTGDLNDGYIYDTPKKVTEIALIECSALKLFPVNTLLIAMYGATIGKLGITKIVASTNQACCALANPQNAIVKFVFYWFLANRNNIISMAYGGGQPNISQNLIKSLRVPLPKIEEQKSIVSFLDQKTAEIDSLIADIQIQIAKLKEYRQALISEAVTGKIDVRNYNISN